ncbi:hypothetical protein LRS74_03730 [Streptomyces sp. LX-29]|uniref:hypothetical protein n=1 Tax=Streptomyces sp. LX-29 TaxID=2900152 RepID=UPI00240CF21F|nr:hypothetical protein [Streptomyces sp. LX-29]WFB06254.1 hypothetical protein LRS74_03730 [Streptomyces sp. LX-29]
MPQATVYDHPRQDCGQVAGRAVGFGGIPVAVDVVDGDDPVDDLDGDGALPRADHSRTRIPGPTTRR